MLDLNSKLKDFSRFLFSIERIEKKEIKLSKSISRRKEKLSTVLKERYKKAGDQIVEIEDYKINEELNLVLRSAILDNRVIIKLPGTFFSQKCVTKRYGYKTYKCWSAADLDLRNVTLDKQFIFTKYASHDTKTNLNFGVLINNKYIDQKKIKDYFNFLNDAISLNKFYRLEIKSLENSDNDEIDLSDLKDFPESYQDLDVYKEKIENIDSLDKLYKKFLVKISAFGRIQDNFLEKIKEYNKPFRLLLQLQEVKL